MPILETLEGEPRTSFYGQNILSISQFNRASLEKLFQNASDIDKRITQGDPSVRDTLRGVIVTLGFFEPSTRTFASFTSAVQRLGGGVVNGKPNPNDPTREYFENQIAIYSAVSDGIILRHKDTTGAQNAASISIVPVINAGSGTGEHPTQALLDLYTIYKKRGSIDGLTIGLVGDVEHGRTVHSLMGGLAQFRGVTAILAAPKALQLSSAELSAYRTLGLTVTQVDDLEEIEKDSLEIAYWTRFQKERLKDQRLTEGLVSEIGNRFSASTETLNRMCTENGMLMHPLPKNQEIPSDMDGDPRSIYFEQSANGILVRMALLQSVFAK